MREESATLEMRTILRPIFINRVAAVGDFGQYAQARPGELMKMKKTTVVVKFNLVICIINKFTKKPWPIHVPAAAVIHEW